MKISYQSQSAWLENACKQVGKWGVYINASTVVDMEEGATEDEARLVFESKFEFGEDFYARAIIMGELSLFDSEEDAFKVYTYFDSGALSDSSVYACIISPSQGTVTENT